VLTGGNARLFALGAIRDRMNTQSYSLAYGASMSLLLRRAAAFAASLAAFAAADCGSPASAPDGAADLTVGEANDLGGSRDLAPVAADFVVAPDLAAGHSVACGNASCPLPGNGCCTATYGASGACFPGDDNGCPSLAAQKFNCDGPEDCTGGAVCCYRVANGASCMPPQACRGGGGKEGYQMCHEAKTCGAQQQCCALGKLAPYSACSSAPCVL
jgi:hypothetical protein